MQKPHKNAEKGIIISLKDELTDIQMDGPTLLSKK